MTKDECKEFLEAFGWEERITRSSLMWAFQKDGMSLNYYYTTGTLTVQTSSEGNPYGQFILKKKKIKDLVQLEEALMEIKK